MRRSLTDVGFVAKKILAVMLAFTMIAGMPGGVVFAMPVDHDSAMAGSCDDGSVSPGCQVRCVAGSAACVAADTTNAYPVASHTAPAARPPVFPSALLRAPDTAPPKAPAI